MAQPITLAELLEILGYRAGETFTLNTSNGDIFRSRRIAYDGNPIDVPTDRNVWHGCNPVTASVDGGRGKATDVTRLAALPVDLDVKPGGCDTFETAWAIIARLSEMLNCDPSAVVLSGHGLQPYWPIDSEPFNGQALGIPDPSEAVETRRQDAQALLRRWGRLVRHVAEQHGAHVDSIFDLARVLRTPGGVNLKGEPVPVVGIAGEGHPLELTEIDELLDQWGATEQPGDRDLTALGVVLSSPDDWTHAETTCIYARKLIDGWQTDTPDARHPWLMSQATRLAVLHAHGCLTEHDHARAREQLAQRFAELLATGEVRPAHVGEVGEALAWGIARASAMTPQQRGDELGNHPHLTALDPFGTGLPALESVAEMTADGATVEPAKLAAVESKAASYGPTEDGTARALVSLYGDTLRYCPERSQWLSWDGTRWRWDHAGRHRELIKAIGRDMPTNGDWKSFKRRALSASGVSGIAALAATDPACIVHIDELDARPWELNTPGGIVDLHTGHARPCEPAALHTRCTPTAPNFEAVSDVFARFLATTFGTPEMARFAQRLFGLVTIGTNLEQILPFFYGASGSNGKSTLVNAVANALGVGDDHYSLAVNSDVLLARTFTEHPAEIAQLAGARLAICSEVEDGARFAEARVKQYTGSDLINARFMRGNPFTFKPTHTFVMLGNSRPNVSSGGDAFWRRCLLVPFDHTVPIEQRDSALPDKLNDDAGIILAWIIRGAAEYAAHGLQVPQMIASATSAYRDDQDTIGRFVDDSCVTMPEAKIPMADLFNAYEKWCSDYGDLTVTKKRFGMELRTRYGVEGLKSNSKAFYVGITMAGFASAEPVDNGPFQ